MRILTEADINQFLDSKVNKASIKDVFSPWLIKSMKSVQTNESIIPPRIVQSSNTPDSDSTHLFMPCIGVNELGLKIITGGPSNSMKGLGFVGSILVMDEYTGALQGVLNAKTITAFRTALASVSAMIRVLDERKAKEILSELTVFGTGLQAYWHVKLACKLHDISKVSIINRSSPSAEALKLKLQRDFPEIEITTILSEDKELTKQAIHNSSFIFGCIPSTEPLIKADYINKDSSILKYINLIGSYKPHMLELEPEVIETEFQNCKVIVDSKSHALDEAGELIKSHRTKDDLVEIVDLYENSALVFSPSSIVLLKIVGLSIMDISIAKFILANTTNGQEVEF